MRKKPTAKPATATDQHARFIETARALECDEDKERFEAKMKRIVKAKPTAKVRQLIGTWQLVSIQFELADTGECVDMYGPNPSGFVILTDGGRFMGIVTSADRAPPTNEADRAALFETMMAYSGRYRVEGENKFITAVDIAWHPAWNGTEQTRLFKLSGDTLSIATAQQTHPLFPGRMGRGVLVFQKA